jgi:outer membrane receptor for ferrienterochelin and colicins
MYSGSSSNKNASQVTRKLTLFIFILFSLVCYTRAQEIKVRVIDDKDGLPVPFCHICCENRVTGKKEYHVGDINGEALVPLKENVILSVSAVGYENYLQTVPLVDNQFEVRLKPTYFGLEEVVVTGQYRPVSIDKSIYNIKFIGKPRIENQAANTMAELLSKELNFRINNDPSTGSSLDLQGISGENVKILVDGVPVIGRLDGNIDLSQINLENVEHIEIVEGPMSVIYGSNALAGVVNIITRENKYSQFRTGVSGYYESVGIYNLNGNVDTRFGNHSLSFTGGRNFFGGYSLVDTSRSQEWKPKEQYNAGTSYSYRKGETSVRYKIDYFRENLLDRSDLFPPYFEKGNDTWFNTTRLNNSLHFDQNLKGGNNIHMLAAYSYYARQKTKYLKDLTTMETVLIPNPEEHDTSVFHSITARGGFNHAMEEGRMDYQVGFDINTEQGTGKRMENGKEHIGDYALFASLQWHLNKHFTFQPAMRVAYNTKYESPVTPSFNIKYEVSKSIFRASYARGFRAPSLKELYLQFYDSNHQIEGNEDLVAERSHNFNLTFNHNSSIRSTPLKLTIKAFYNVIQDRISLIQVDPDNPLHYKNANTDHFESLGGDISFVSHPYKYLSLDAGLSYIGRKDSYYQSDEFIFSPSAIANMSLMFFKSKATANLFYKYSGKYPVHTYLSDDEIALTYLDAYHNMDLNLSVKLFRQQVRLSTGIKNIFNNTQLVGAGEGSGHGGGDGASSLVGWGRTFFLGINYNFTKH